MDNIVRLILNTKWFKLAFTVFVFTFVGLLVGLMMMNIANIRLLLSVAILLGLVAISLRWPFVVLFLLTIYLPLLGIIRRMLIPVAGWSSSDPLILIPSVLISILAFNWFYKHYISRELVLVDTKLLRLVFWLIVVEAFQVANPVQGSPMVGLSGMLFYLLPLFWMIVARTYITEQHLKRLVKIVFTISIVTALYGLKQIYFGLFSFEYLWVQYGGYAALMITHDIVRAFSTFSSAQEYAQYLSFGIIIALVLALKGNKLQRIAGIVTYPLLVFSLFMESSRTPLVLAILSSAIVVVLSRKKGKRLLATGAVVGCLVVVYGGLTLIASSNPIVAHQVNGIVNPADEEHSSAGLHTNMVIDGFKTAMKFPVGRGLGTTSLMGGKLGTGVQSTELDLTDAFISSGLIGGGLLLLIYLKAHRLAFSYVNNGSKLSLIIAGTLCTMTGNWLMGANYSIMAWIWLIIGFLDVAMKDHAINSRVRV